MPLFDADLKLALAAGLALVKQAQPPRQPQPFSRNGNS